MQVRFLGANGHELIRVDREKNSKRIHIVADHLLQDKSNRYYFKETAQLAARQFWHSNLDLNVEKGQLEMPLRPTLRVATPIYSHNQFFGIVIINVDAENTLVDLSTSSDFKVMLIDGDGEILQHPDNTMSWSRYLPNKRSFKELYPNDASRLITDPDIHLDNMYSFSIDSIFRNGEKLQVIMMPKDETISNLIQSNVFAAFLIASIVFVISFPLSWLAAMFPARLQAKLRSTLDELQKTTQVLDQNVMTSTTNIKGEIINVSSAFSEITGYHQRDLQGQTHRVVKSSSTSNETYQDLWETISSGKTWRGELKNQTKSNESFWISTVITPKKNNEGNIVGYVQISQDISAKKEIEKLSVTDVLTQLFNRRKLDQVLEAEMQRFKRYKQSFSVIILDLDHFKLVNDNHGHQAGDDVLIQTAQCLKSNIRLSDCAGRWGGEEFLIICAGTDSNGAKKIAEKLRTSIELLTFSFPLQVTASFGIAQCAEKEALNQLIGRADQALYNAKSQGRNRVAIATEET